MKALVGNYDLPILLEITGGNPNMNCAPSKIQFDMVAGDPGYKEFIHHIKGGEFCYKMKDGRGDIDVILNTKQPMNYDCDPLVLCQNIAEAPFLCRADITVDIIDPVITNL
jgi:hypothetical protein